MNRAALFGVVVALAACSTEPGKACTLRGCESGLDIDVGVFPASDFVVNTTYYAEADVCLNDACGTYFFETVPSDQRPLLLTAVNETDIAVRLIYTSTDSSRFADGDVFRVTLRNTNREVIADRSWSVTYMVSYPNGPGCDTCLKPLTVTER